MGSLFQIIKIWAHNENIIASVIFYFLTNNNYLLGNIQVLNETETLAHKTRYKESHLLWEY